MKWHKRPHCLSDNQSWTETECWRAWDSNGWRHGPRSWSLYNPSGAKPLILFGIDWHTALIHRASHIHLLTTSLNFTQFSSLLCRQWSQITIKKDNTVALVFLQANNFHCIRYTFEKIIKLVNNLHTVETSQQMSRIIGNWVMILILHL